MPQRPENRVIAVAGAVIGAIVGFGCVELLDPHGIHAVVVPAALPGVIAALLSKERSIWWALIYGTLGLVAALVAEWRSRPFIVDASAGYFFRHLYDLHPKVKMAIALGVVIGAVNSLTVFRVRRAPPENA